MNTRFDPELSRLAFEDRLIEFCEGPDLPLLDRVGLLGIAAGRLDVFFMTRVGRLKRMVAGADERHRSAGLKPAEQLAEVSVEASRIMRRAYRLLTDDLLPKLAANGIRIERWQSLSDDDREYLRRTCGLRLGDLVTPVIIDQASGAPNFPHVRNLRPALVALGRKPGGAGTCIVVAELPAELPRLVPLRREQRFVPLEDILSAELGGLCSGLDGGEIDAHLFRVTRNAATEYEGEYDILGDVEQEVVRRPFQEVVRLEVESAMPAALREQLVRAFQCETDTLEASLGESDTYVVPGLVDITALEEIAALDLPRLKSAPVAPIATRVDHLLASPSQDELLHLPFDDYETSLERFLAEAARHPDLESIQTTIYRTDADSGVVAALRAANARGADVNVVVELKASFDERDNIELARGLSAAGIRVVLSPAEFKVHAKVALVTLRTGGESRRIALIGTGNMNAVTARTYIDLWLVTAEPACTREVAALFDVVNGRSADAEFDCLLVAPFDMRRRFLELIERETSHATAGRPSGIRAMMNGLTDPPVISALYRASQAGVPVELMIRGVCLLRPGEPGISENIRIVSLAGRLLQHARIFHFRNGGDDAYFIGSADWRPRNFDHRMEVITRLRRAEHKASLDRILTEALNHRDGWVLGSDGVYVRRTDSGASAAA